MILCCRIPEIPIAALILKHGADLRGRALVVGGHPSERQPVRAASPEAQSYGICAGMPLRQAEQLCPEALFFPIDPAAETDLRRNLLAGLYGLAPRVELADSGEAYVDLDGMCKQVEREYRPGGVPEARSALTFANRRRAAVRRGPSATRPPEQAGHLAFTAQLAFAEKVGHYLEGRLLTRPALGIGSNKFVAFTAASVAGARPHLVPQGSERSLLASLPVAGNMPGLEELAERLLLFGLKTMGSLAALPRDVVEAQFGLDGLLALRLARGEDPRPFVPWEPPPRMEEESSLDPPVESLEPLLFVARGLIERLGERIANGGYAVTKLRLMLTLDVSRAERENGAARVQAVLRLPSPMGGADDLWLPVSTLIRHQQIKRPVVAISLRVSGFCPASSRQLDLLTRRDGTLELLVRQLALLQDSPVTVRVPEVCAHGSILEERRFHWRDPVEVLQRRAARSVA